jgi:hypothetical protein
MKGGGKIRGGIGGDWRGRTRGGEEDKEEEGQLFKGKHYGEAKQPKAKGERSGSS